LVEGFGEEVICDLNIPLKITIHYFNGLLLTRQEMLTISPDSDLRINPETGQTLLKVKLAELSSKHEGNLFFLRILSSDPLIGGICPILTSGVEVRSKDTSTNKRPRPMSDPPSEGIDQSSTNQIFPSFELVYFNVPKVSVVVGHSFDFQISLRNSRNHQRIYLTSHQFSLHLSLVLQDDTPCDDILEIVSCVIEDGNFKVRVLLRDVSYGESKFKFKGAVSRVLSCSQSSEQGQEMVQNVIAEATSNSFGCIRYRLVVENFPSVWFQAQGGKDNHFPFNVKLVGDSDEVIRGLNIPLTITIHSPNKELLSDQGILKFSLDSNLRILEAGRALVKAKIEGKLRELANKYGTNSFRLKISPSDETMGGIPPVFTSVLEVLSKDPSRNANATKKRATTDSTDLSTSLPPQKRGKTSSNNQEEWIMLASRVFQELLPEVSESSQIAVRAVLERLPLTALQSVNSFDSLSLPPIPVPVPVAMTNHQSNHIEPSSTPLVRETSIDPTQCEVLFPNEKSEISETLTVPSSPDIFKLFEVFGEETPSNCFVQGDSWTFLDDEEFLIACDLFPEPNH